jgi:hypothetical protein
MLAVSRDALTSGTSLAVSIKAASEVSAKHAKEMNAVASNIRDDQVHPVGGNEQLMMLTGWWYLAARSSDPASVLDRGAHAWKARAKWYEPTRRWLAAAFIFAVAAALLSWIISGAAFSYADNFTSGDADWGLRIAPIAAALLTVCAAAAGWGTRKAWSKKITGSREEMALWMMSAPHLDTSLSGRMNNIALWTGSAKMREAAARISRGENATEALNAISPTAASLAAEGLSVEAACSYAAETREANNERTRDLPLLAVFVTAPLITATLIGTVVGIVIPLLRGTLT